MKSGDRYDASKLPEGQFEPGSGDRVLKNRLGIKTPEEMERVETRALGRVTATVLSNYDEAHRFTAADICAFHRLWLGEIYEWAGEYRQVNISKGDFMFAAASRIPALMEEFERGALARHTPCNLREPAEIARAVAETHVELVLIHPFRDGNGRVARLLASLMALQAGMPLLDFSILAEAKRADYFAAVRAGLDRDYGTMARLFEEVIARSLSSP